MTLKHKTDSIKQLVIDYLCCLELDEMGELNDDLSVKNMNNTVTALFNAIEKQETRPAKILYKLLSHKIKVNETE